MRRLYPDQRAEDVAAVLGFKVARVRNKAFKLGLKKSAAFKASDLSARIRRGMAPGAVRHQFEKGQSPWNKGVPGSTGHHPNVRATQFKKGRRPEENSNHQPIGAARITKDGYLEQKVTDDQSVPARRRWVPVHRLVWEREHGAIPADHIVVFRPGMKTAVLQEVTVDRLECVSRAENGRRNHFRRHGPEMARLYQLKGAIARQVNRIAREAKENPS